MLGAQNRTPHAIGAGKEAVLRMQARTVAVAALALGALAAPATAQIIATSIPKSIAGGGGGRWAFHLMYSPYAKWRINTFDETVEPDNVLFLATGAKPKADFLGAAEVAFKAGDAATIGIGGWYNKIGRTTADYVFFQTDQDGDFFLAGPMDLDVTYTEGHANLFYKDLGVQFGIVHSSRTVAGMTADVATLNDEDLDLNAVNQILTTIEGTKETANDLDGYLIYKVGGTSGNDTNWSFSLGGGFYRYDALKKNVPSAFATATVGLYKGLGVDASYWYVGKTKRSDLQQALHDSGLDLDQNLSRWMVGVSYTFSR
jgi:hypothetical protein